MYIGPEVLSVNGMPEQAITHCRAAVQWALHLLCNSCVASIARLTSIARFASIACNAHLLA